LASTRQEQITSLTADLEKSKKDVEMKHSIGIRWKARADTLTQEARSRQTTLEEKEKAVAELTTKVEGLTKELEGSKAKIGELEKKAAAPAPAPAPAAAATPTSAEVPTDSAELVSPNTSVEIEADM
jgi:predicted  nucleic acid-binding Zn-ribbon protein